MYTSGIVLTVGLGLGERQWRLRVGVAVRRWCYPTHIGNEVSSCGQCDKMSRKGGE